MHSLFSSSLFILAGLLPSFFVEAAPSSPLLTELHDIETRASTCNTPSNRACWTDDFNISTNYETSWPTTGVVRSYNLVLTEQDNWVGPDGVVRSKIMLINGQTPGPTIEADWGDTIQVTVTNSLRDNGTSIHWHGIRQLNSNLQDGANGVTECPVPPKGASKVYTFLATQYGTSWYHSHFSAQYANGILGPIQINGPASLNYDIDLGTFPVSDYYYRTADDLVEFTKTNPPPPSDNVLFNGTNVNPTTGAGSYANVTLTPGKRHLLRIINTSAENHFILSLRNHSMTIIANDLVPVNAQTVDSLFVAIGQRYDVTIDASQTPGNYWFNATFVQGPLFPPCGFSNNPTPAAIFHYDGAPGGLPTDPGVVINAPTTCSDSLTFSPVVSETIDVSQFQPNTSNTLDVTLDGPPANPTFVWMVNGSAINVDWNMPVDQYVMENNMAFPRSENIVRIEAPTGSWTYWLIVNDPATALPHPFHLHGHDFVVLGRSDPNDANPPPFDPATANLNGTNPTRRDVTMLPSLGWLAIAFKADNPGAWLMHCHIAWHVSGGLSVDFLEHFNDMQAQFASQPTETAAFQTNCAAWNAYFPLLDPFPKQDSGLRI